MERVTGIEPALSAWEADVLPLNYTRVFDDYASVHTACGRPHPGSSIPTGYGGGMSDRNVLGGELAECSRAPLTGFYRDGCCSTGPEDLGSHTVCSMVTAEFLEHQRSVGNDLMTPRPEYGFAGLRPGDRWCVCAARWLQSYEAGFAAPVMLRSTNEAALRIVPREALVAHAADAPDDTSTLDRS